MTSVAEYLVEPNNTIQDNKKQIPLYEHAGLHMVLRKIIGHDNILEKNNESKNNFLSEQQIFVDY